MFVEFTGIYAEGYLAFALTFVRSYVRVFIRSLLSFTFVEFTTKFLVKVSLSEYISNQASESIHIRAMGT